MEKRLGPSMEPWETPQELGFEEGGRLLKETLKDLLDQYEENQFKAGPEPLAH